ncbi:hypothetical protein CAF53_26385 [Sphingobium sp. LB126]|nr:hypothetical protein CAF53_26385 [Sphingobium sp. LB126]
MNIYIKTMTNRHDFAKFDMNLLLVFDALLREKTLTRAGQSLGITQSGASHALKRLRVFFGDRSSLGRVPASFPRLRAGHWVRPCRAW